MLKYSKKTIRRTFVGTSAQLWQQLCGMNVMMYYIVYIFYMAGFSGKTNLVFSSIQTIINVVVTIPALIFMDRLGRRPILLVGGVLIIWLFTQAGILVTCVVPVDAVNGNTTVIIITPKENTSAAKAVVACSYLFVASFAPT
ncbi:hypothetical protein NADFUDRAFT_49313 [Nadsonia fulvescens var. elongata DSM 6958]|uniref:General substrate transporter n=1 Tax=Nadsonia fulvescens var. elongata DSM 6958 TaxID=857566 RepID=A0A1E3PTT1_9ASCO|nr:hypothetical protein NADFUDRAFT_49313 [Nadsonia fulvescens var. elongata DSM 6958]